MLLMNESVLSLNEIIHRNIGFPTFKLPAFMIDPLNIVFDDFGI